MLSHRSILKTMVSSKIKLKTSTISLSDTLKKSSNALESRKESSNLHEKTGCTLVASMASSEVSHMTLSDTNLN